MKKLIPIAFFLLIQFSYAQKRVEQGVIYSPGERVYVSIAGLESVIPDMWMGMAPQGTESFLLIPTDNSNAQIIVLVTKDSIEAIEKRWQGKSEFANGIFLETEEKPYNRNGWMAADIKISGSSTSPKGYVEAKCGEWGICVINLLIARKNDVDELKKGLISFSDACVFTKPRAASRYENFDWLSYLQNKTIIRWTHDPNYKQNNQVHLCKDGQFQSKLKTSGIVKGEKSPYFGKNWGEWEVQGQGFTAKLYLYFNKLSSLIVDLEMQEGGKLYVNDIQYFSILSNKCPD